MAIIVITNDAEELLKKCRIYLDHERNCMWKYDMDGDFTITSLQWQHKAWMRPRKPKNGKLEFGIVRESTRKMTCGVYNYYHSRFLELLLLVGDNLIDSIEVSPKLRPGVDVF